MIRQEAAPRRPTRVLLCDDAPEHRALVRAILAGEDAFEVVGEARDGATCLTAIALTRPDLLVLDLQMPGRDGFAVLEELAQRDDAPRVLVISSADESSVRDRVAAYGVDFLPKGRPPSEVVDAVRRAAAA